jgi:outer membrane protein TolC/ABC-type uncharacterized transport system substrate-binding protein
MPLTAPFATQKVRIGFIEGGDYPWHSVLRELFREEFERMLPDTVEAVFVAEGYITANWDRDLLNQQVQRLVARKSIDLAVAIGPWAAEALLDAGFKGGIVALHRLEPVTEGLVDSSLKPIASNLTVNIHQGRFEKDLSALFSLKPVKRLGVLVFGSPEQNERLADSLRTIAARANIELVNVSAYNAKGTFVFYKAYQLLDKKIDALYISSTWGLSAEITGEFLRMVAQDGISVFSSEGPFQVTRGAFAANSGSTGIAEPYFAAWKAVRIVAGEQPDELPTVMRPLTGLAINEATALKTGVTVDDFVAVTALWVPRPSVESDPVVTLSLAISQAIAAHPGYLARYEAIEAAGRAADASSSAYLPQLGLDGSLGYVDDNTTNNSAPEQSNLQAGARLTLTQRLFSPVTLRRMKLAKEVQSATEIALTNARLDLEFAVLTAYANLVQAQELLTIETDGLTHIDRFLEYRAAGRNIERESDNIALTRWKAERQLVAGRVLQARANVAAAQIALNVLTGMPTGTRFVPDPTPFSREQFVEEAYALRPLIGYQRQRSRRAEQLVAQAIGNSPAFARIDNQLEQQATRTSLVKADYLPEIGFRADLGLQDRLEDRPGFEEKSVTWQIGADLSWSLWTGGSRGDLAAVEVHRHSELEYQRDELSGQLTEKVQTGITRLSAEMFDGVLCANASLDAEIYITEMARRPDTSLTVVLDAIHTVYMARTRSLAARMSYFGESFELARLLGWSMYDRNSVPSHELITALSAPK